MSVFALPRQRVGFAGWWGASTSWNGEALTFKNVVLLGL